MDLENILIKYQGGHFKVFKNDGNFTVKGYEVYCDFCNFIYEFGEFVGGVDSEKIEKQLDIIVNSR